MNTNRGFTVTITAVVNYGNTCIFCKKKKKPLHEEINMTFAVTYFATHLNI